MPEFDIYARTTEIQGVLGPLRECLSAPNNRSPVNRAAVAAAVYYLVTTEKNRHGQPKFGRPGDESLPYDITDEELLKRHRKQLEACEIIPVTLRRRIYTLVFGEGAKLTINQLVWFICSDRLTDNESAKLGLSRQRDLIERVRKANRLARELALRAVISIA